MQAVHAILQGPSPRKHVQPRQPKDRARPPHAAVARINTEGSLQAAPPLGSGGNGGGSASTLGSAASYEVPLRDSSSSPQTATPDGGYRPISYASTNLSSAYPSAFTPM